ncbi:MAG: MFS transporter [Rubrivivax sp.]
MTVSAGESTRLAPGTPPGPGFGATVAALSVAQILAWAALYYGFTSFVLPMTAELGWSKPTLMGAFTLGLAMAGLCTYAAGSLIDRGHGRVLMTAGSLLSALGFALWAAVREPWQLYAAWVLLGAAMAMVLYEPAFAILTRRYPLRYRQGITTLTLVAGFASTLSFPAFAWLIGAFGWREALWATAGLFLFVITPLNAWALQGPATGQAPPDDDAVADATLREALRTRAFWLLTLAFTLDAFVMAGLWAHMIPLFAARGASEAQAVAVLVWIGPAQVAGRVLLVAFGKRWPLRHVGTAVLAGLALSMGLLATGTTLTQWLVFAVVYGLSAGTFTIVRGGIVPLYFGRAHIGRIGGAISSVGLVARAAAPVMLAWLLLAVPGYREVLGVLALLGAASVVAFLLAGRPRVER